MQCKSSGDNPGGNKLFTLQAHKSSSNHVKASRNWNHHACMESLQGPKLGLIWVHEAFTAVVNATAPTSTEGRLQIVSMVLTLLLFSPHIPC